MTPDEFWTKAFLAALTRVSPKRAEREALKATRVFEQHLALANMHDETISRPSINPGRVCASTEVASIKAAPRKGRRDNRNGDAAKLTPDRKKTIQAAAPKKKIRRDIVSMPRKSVRKFSY